MANAQIEKLLSVANDDERHPLIVENTDWENTITPALCEFGEMLEDGVLSLPHAGTYVLLRALFEEVYVMGHRAGKAQAQNETLAV